MLLKHEDTICLVCQLTLPKTNDHLDPENPVLKSFWGRVKVEMASSCYHFSKQSRVQQLLHQLKYKGVKEVGRKVGLWYGQELLQAECYQNIDYVIPVPLHKNKMKQRGFNQSEFFARGLAESMNIELNCTDFIRVEDSKTQTKKSRYDRWENVAEIFALQADSVLKGKTILLVDDVVTTGATLEAAILELKKYRCKVLVATMARA
ncbi:MAG: ComF family protein [Flavobacteriales bacterium]|nr:ComF family protein [Flavobacteriales bacterium]